MKTLRYLNSKEKFLGFAFDICKEYFSSKEDFAAMASNSTSMLGFERETTWTTVLAGGSSARDEALAQAGYAQAGTMGGDGAVRQSFRP